MPYIYIYINTYLLKNFISGNKTHKKIEKGNKLLKLYYEKPCNNIKRK
ncbi:hypothetical protein PFFVO_03997 [Plasmodium falciparum Vietnam Oak-Knoll (FVO)]|uniref:Uncharacterized protein n=1 Tax=Plasmodium falciparum Vietnam Oak-Knoll (FVO) TaxID=1036723 RepID=A0A024V4Q6_PLAFA|nr:hypothetical protein PFFVO_03997 [Plasmodium falciparum Vietnam Oak-Knoll (FVO)]